MMPMKKDHLEILLEDIRGKFELVLEGHESLSRKMDGRFDELNEKIEHNSFLIGTLNKKIDDVENKLGAKIDAVAADLAAHRADTEAHGPVYRVKESRD
jgi:outer membrane murein-binding lipoprotein Lpp